MRNYRVSEAAALLGVSDDTVRRLVDSGQVPAETDSAGRLTIPGPDLAAYAESRPQAAEDPFGGALSARNRLTGIVTEVRTDGVMGQVQLRCGPHRITSLISADSVRDLGLEPGALAVAVIKATTVIIESEGAAE
ncbi:TOBE domain-containing protein [Enemella evansiae]|uniref:TOBE domain-containing protein n=1 Tax=Enemella evansiae TaxID=2016499 RepID=UPI0010E91BA7|nr:TOBE domain-containing protein [Enemella evansiae]TDO94576.1 molybdopterin-binding protein [Enemella evansiae]